MKIFSKVTRKTLFANRTRTVVTIIGIILSAAMLTAVTTGVVSVWDYLRRCAIWDNGNWHGYFEKIPAGMETQIEQDDDVKSAFYAQQIGYALIGSRNEDKPYLYVMGIGQEFAENMPVRITEGRMPQTSGEILLPEHLERNGGVEHALGDVLTLELGDRVWGNESLSQCTSYWHEEEDSPGETLIIREQRSYTVVGFYERPGFESYMAPGYTALTRREESAPSGYIDVWVLLKEPKKIYDYLDQAAQKYGCQGYDANSNVLRFEGVSGFRSYHMVLMSMGAILVALIMFGSVSLIYNAFSISVSERTRQFGILSSVGATKKQIRSMVLSEALYVSAVGIPVGIVSGIIGLSVTFSFIGDKFHSLYGTEEVNLRMAATPAAILIALGVGIVTVLISAWIPSRRAMRVSPIEAVRQSQDIRVRKREVKISPLHYRLFGLEGMLAAKHFRRSRKKYRATVASLFMSIVLFVSTVSFCRYLNDAVTGTFAGYDYDIKYTWYPGMTGKDGNAVELAHIMQVLSEADGVTQMSVIWTEYMQCGLSFSDMPEKLARELKGLGYVTEEPYPISIRLCLVDDTAYQAYLQQLGLAEIGEGEGILMNQKKGFNGDTGRVEKTVWIREDISSLQIYRLNWDEWEAFVKENDLDQLSSEEYEQARMACSHIFTAQIGAVADVLPFGLNASEVSLAVVYPREMFRRLYTDTYESLFAGESCSLYFKGQDHIALMESLTRAARENGLEESGLYDVYATDEDEKNLVTIVKVFSYGFIALISLIAMANVFNTITTNILLRRREFAMLRSVGMTGKGLHKMLDMECVMYGLKSLILGIPAAVGVTWLIFRSIGLAYDTSFYLPWTAIAAAATIVFAEVFAGMLYVMRKISRDNPVEALKNENI
ncbi:MAG: ABC transporter permease [Lachnospiraceae bacterium]|nr:ABC transporter permease [Lachnospiraceae bacterium]